MKSMLNKISIGTAFLLLGATSVFGQNDQGQYSSHENGDSCCNRDCESCEKCCPPKSPCANCAQLWPSEGPDWIITPNAGPCVSNSCGMFLTAEFIYWTIREDNLGFAFTNESSQTTATALTEPSTLRGSVRHPDWNMSPGFKVGLGWMTGCDGWDLYLNYTWLRARNTDESLNAPSNDLIINDLNWTTQATGQSSTSASRFGVISRMTGDWEQDLNVLDLELGRNFFISQCLHLRPHFGFKGSWRKQSMDVVAYGTSDSLSLPVDVVANSRNRIDSWGFGIRAGLDSAWHFSRCFSLVGEAAVSALWGKFDVTIKEYMQNLSTELYTVTNNVKNDFHTIKPVLELYMGLRWEDWFCCDAYHYSVELGWEEQWWSNENQYFSVEPIQLVNNGPYRSRLIESRLGDLFMHGLTVKLRFDF